MPQKAPPQGQSAGNTAFWERARAKVNLTLRIPGRRPDGYHQVESLIVFADAPHDVPGTAASPAVAVAVADHVRFDPLEATTVEAGGGTAASIEGENIVSTALARLARAEPRLRLGRVTIEKNLPVAAGLGGGSANAAALLRAVRRANRELAGAVDWSSIAASLGADVPVCLEDRTSWVTGFGESIRPIPTLPPLAGVLVNPRAAVPADKTAQVFRRLGAGPLDPAYSVPGPPRFADAEELLAFMAHAGNDLTDAARAVVPEIASVLDAIHALPGCRYAALSGAGPTCFGIFNRPGKAADHLSAQHPTWWVRAVHLGD